MIKGILFALFFVLLFVALGLIVLFSIKKYKEEEEYQRGLQAITHDKYGYNKQYDPKDVEVYKKSFRRKSKGGLIGAVIASVAMLGLVITIPGSFHQVEAGTYAVVKKIGKIVEVRSPGTYFDFYMTKKYETYDATVQQVKINTSAYSKDGQTMDLEVYLQYQIQLDKLVLRDESGKILQTEGIAGKYVTLDSLQARIETQCIEKTKAVMSSAEAMVIIQDRAKYSEDVSRVVRDAIGPDYYVNVQDVVLTNIDFTDEFEKSVEDKVVAEQQKQAAITKAEAEKETAIIKAEQELATARIEAEKKIVEAQADARQQLILAQAAAEAATYNIVELAKVVGYKVDVKYIYTTDVKVEKSNGESSLVSTETVVPDTKEDETSTIVVTTETIDGEQVTVTTTTTKTLTSTKYNIDITSGPGAHLGSEETVASTFRSLIEDYLQYLAYLEQWNGELPQVVAGDDAISIIIPNN